MDDMDGWCVDGWMDGLMHKWMGVILTDGKVDEWPDGWISGWVDDIWVNGWTDGWRDGENDKWIEGWCMAGWQDRLIDKWMDNLWVGWWLDGWMRYGWLDDGWYFDWWCACMAGWFDRWMNAAAMYKKVDGFMIYKSVDRWLDEWYRWMDDIWQSMNVCMNDIWMDRLMTGWTIMVDGWLDGWLYEWVGGWIDDIWMVGWISTSIWRPQSSSRARIYCIVVVWTLHFCCV